jgi:hypothetical protein
LPSAARQDPSHAFVPHGSRHPSRLPTVGNDPSVDS